ncbi:MAG: lipoyl synthase [bacterium]
MRLSNSPEFARVQNLILTKDLHTVCQEANCPNRGECYGSGTATFLILGDRCTRGCTFCNVSRGKPDGYDLAEAGRVADAVRQLKLNYVVITSVTRDDLPDGGSELFARVTRAVHAVRPGCQVELLIPDFRGDHAAFARVASAAPEVLNHNLETVERLYTTVRRGADYRRSLELFDAFRALDQKLILKSGLMVGLGETVDELKQAFRDLVEHDCQMLTIGQYLQPSPEHHPVIRFYHPDEFEELGRLALAAGFKVVESAPLVRSSYHARESFARIMTGRG